jgi:pimeloyl-ACP methyl ester carboxylesterase
VTEEVVLVPGLWMPAVALALLSARLERAGFRTQSFAYSGREPLEQAIERLGRLVRERSVHFIGHSLGGVLIFDLLQTHRDIAARRVVLLGSPVLVCPLWRMPAGRRSWTPRHLYPPSSWLLRK